MLPAPKAVAVVADLETANVAAFTADMNGTPVVVVNQLARCDPAVRAEAVHVLEAAGVEAEVIHEVLHGIRR